MTTFATVSTGATDVGLKRAVNEDSIYVSDGKGFWLVADGMGGHKNGAMASRTAVKGFEALEVPLEFDEAIAAVARRMHEVNARIAQLSEQNGGEQMGTTAVSLLIRGDRFAVTWVGDSRAYIFRRGGLFQLSVDHTHVQDLVDEGILKPEEAAAHPMGHVLTRALGVEPEVQVDVMQDTIEPGDRFVICSDGLTGPVSDEAIRTILMETPPGQSVERLIQAAHAGGAPDNVSVIIISTEAL